MEALYKAPPYYYWFRCNCSAAAAAPGPQHFFIVASVSRNHTDSSRHTCALGDY